MQINISINLNTQSTYKVQNTVNHPDDFGSTNVKLDEINFCKRFKETFQN